VAESFTMRGVAAAKDLLGEKFASNGGGEKFARDGESVFSLFGEFGSSAAKLYAAILLPYTNR